MAELAPVGMFMADSSGKIIFTNDTWHDIAQYPRDTPVAFDWINYVKEEDRERCRKTWDIVVNELTPVRVEFRFKHPWKDEFGNTGETWALASSFPEKTLDGKLKSIFGSVTDISTQKFAEGLQKKRMEEAMEMKRQQENFVDITSKML
jgi:PAS domain S-box-containing protein